MSFRSSSTKRMAASSAVAGTIVVIPSKDGTGPTLSGSGVTANTVIKTQVVTVGSNTTTTASVSSGPKISNVYVTDNSYNNLDDTSLDSNGGYLKVIGTGFKTGCVAYTNGNSLTTNFVSSSELRLVVPASATGTYSLMVFNPDGNGAIYLNLGVSNVPTFTTPAGSLGTVYETQQFTQSVSASGDSPFTYSLYSGSLPPGATLNSDGTISGTSQTESGSSTYSFVVNVKDAQNQDTQRSFNLTIAADVVTWSTPENNITYSLPGGSAISNVTLSATSATGYPISYSANTLPTGLTLSGNTIYGTPTTEQSIYTELTATTSTTNRSAKQYVLWTISVADAYFKNNSLLISANINSPANNNIFLDSSTYNNAITRNGNTTQGTYSPYGDNWSVLLNTAASQTGSITLPSANNSTASADFTIECWAMRTAISTLNCLAMVSGSSATTMVARLQSTGAWTVLGTALTTANADANIFAAVGRWFHLAVVRQSGTLRVYIDGVQVYSGANATTYTLTGGTGVTQAMIGNYNGNTGQEWVGYVSNYRIVNGTAVYPNGTTFTPSSTPLSAIPGTVVLTCRSPRFVDNGPNNLSLSTVGTPSIQKHSPFNTVTVPKYYSTYFNGVSDYLTVPDSDALRIGTNDFTIECWIYKTENASSESIFTIGPSTTSGAGLIFYSPNNKLSFYTGQGNAVTSDPDVFPLNQWVHVAVVRSSSTLKLYVNGTLKTSTTWSTSLNPSGGQVAYIGKWIDGINFYFNGAISNLRVLNGTALYSSNFTPSTSPLSVIANTALLTCQNNTFVDNSNNNLVITSGTTTVKPMATSPFTPTASSVSSYSKSTFGGSMYFDGTGDNLLIADNSSLQLTTNNFTIEGWFNTSSINTNNGILNLCANGTTNYISAVYLYIISSNSVRLQVSENGTTFLTSVDSATITANTWYHFAVVRNGQYVTLYLNGVSVGSVTLSSASASLVAGTYHYIGTSKTTTGTARDFVGYISDVKITKGTAIYTSNFYPNSVPTTATVTGPYGTLLSSVNTANATLLLSGTNGGIIDQTRTVNLETVGNVTTVTNTYPYSSAGQSYYFDGTGDYLTIPSNVVLDFGTGDFTIECWVKFSALNTNRMIFDRWATGNANSWQLYWKSSTSSLTFLVGSTTVLLQEAAPGGTISANTWYHVAVTRASGTNKMFINGNVIATATDSTSLSNALPLVIGRQYSTSTNDFNGYLSDIRITKGYARYTTSFVPPTVSMQTR